MEKFLARNISETFDLKILLSVRILSQNQEIVLHLSLVFPSPLSQEKGNVKPDGLHKLQRME